MFGFIIGTLSLIGLIKTVRGGCGYGRHGGYGRWGGGFQARQRWMLRGLFHRLGTTTAQETVIYEAINSVQAFREKVWREAQQTRTEVSESFSGEAFDETKIRAAHERHQALLSELQKVTSEAMAKVHAVLQPDQRRFVSQLIQYGFHGMHRGMHGGCGRGGYGRGGFGGHDMHHGFGGPVGDPMHL